MEFHAFKKVINYHMCIEMFLACVIGWHCRSHVPEEFQDFFSLPRSEQRCVLLTYPINKQIDIYLIDLARIEPPNNELGIIIGTQGKKAVIPLLERIRKEKNDEVIANLIFVFRFMPRGTDLYKDKNLLEELYHKVSLMRDTTWKSQAQQFLEVLNSIEVQITHQ